MAKLNDVNLEKILKSLKDLGEKHQHLEGEMLTLQEESLKLKKSNYEMKCLLENREVKMEALQNRLDNLVTSDQTGSHDNKGVIKMSQKIDRLVKEVDCLTKKFNKGMTRVDVNEERLERNFKVFNRIHVSAQNSKDVHKEVDELWNEVAKMKHVIQDCEKERQQTQQQTYPGQPQIQQQTYPGQLPMQQLRYPGQLQIQQQTYPGQLQMQHQTQQQTQQQTQYQTQQQRLCQQQLNQQTKEQKPLQLLKEKYGGDKEEEKGQQMINFDPPRAEYDRDDCRERAPLTTDAPILRGIKKQSQFHVSKKFGALYTSHTNTILKVTNYTENYDHSPYMDMTTGEYNVAVRGRYKFRIATNGKSRPFTEWILCSDGVNRRKMMSTRVCDGTRYWTDEIEWVCEKGEKVWIEFCGKNPIVILKTVTFSFSFSGYLKD